MDSQNINRIVYFKYNFKTKKIEYYNYIIAEIEHYHSDAFFARAFKDGDSWKILNSNQLDSAVLYKNRRYLKYFLKENFSQLFKEIDCFDWIIENKNIIRKLLK